MSDSTTTVQARLVAELLAAVVEDQRTSFDEPVRRLADGAVNPAWVAMRANRRRIEALRRELYALDRPQAR